MRQRGWPRRWRDALIEGLHASSSIGQRTKLAGCPGRDISNGATQQPAIHGVRQQPAIDGAPADGAVGPLVCQATARCDARTGRSGGADARCAAARPNDYSDATGDRYSDATGQRDGDDAPRER